MTPRFISYVLFSVLLLSGEALAVKPTSGEMKAANAWFDAGSSSTSSMPIAPPFSFEYDGKHSDELLWAWAFSEKKTRIDSTRIQLVQTYTDKKTGLEVRCVAVRYFDFPVLEWTVYLKNTGSADTPVIENIRTLDASLGTAKGEFLLHHNKGTVVDATDYEPKLTTIADGDRLRLAPPGGHPCRGENLPYFNAEWNGGGAIVAIGWPGEWSAEFSAKGGKLNVTAGQDMTHLKLHPGEEIRTPLVAVLFWQGDYLRSQNLWRRWMLAHNTPKPGGKALGPRLAAVSGNHYPGLRCTQQDEIFFINRYLSRGIDLGIWWMDAGWYPCGDWYQIGTWEVDKSRFPGGIRAISDHAHAKGMKTVLWFEPERVTVGSRLYGEHPEWLIGADGVQKIFDFGNPEARKWMTDMIDGIITAQGIDIYRHDFNIPPLSYWRGNDAEDRQGITENQYVTGLLAYWDELIKRHPGMLIDICHRFELEALRRAVPQQRSEFWEEPASQQCQTYTYTSWIPYHGEGVPSENFPKSETKYRMRSALSSTVTLNYDMRKSDFDYDFDTARKVLKEWREVIAPNYAGDLYPLTPYSKEQTVWAAWQYDRPEVGKGVVQVFRRHQCEAQSAIFKLHGLDPKSWYNLTDLDTGKTFRMKGGELMGTGLTIEIPDKPGSAVIAYEKTVK